MYDIIVIKPNRSQLYVGLSRIKWDKVQAVYKNKHGVHCHVMN